MKTVTLNSGVEMPILGFGVFQIPDYEECKNSVLEALKTGYKSIDTAQAYGNEKAVGDAIKESGIPREELFITTKLWKRLPNESRYMASATHSIYKTGLENNTVRCFPCFSSGLMSKWLMEKGLDT